ncbi:hypothetical protein A5638_00645 [Mycolicibacterium fortuitum]|uniref:hypothetical protein n=1 Tax=Mycolicibacterium fortuitum TaxID=1766 RepID=UPI0007EC6F45|nr:hypothetical protein [Mycolicibacterium fortuitum]OBK00163.1 hypothetical protein A5638_00645 [Mycolicibacterium fortuitum]
MNPGSAVAALTRATTRPPSRSRCTTATDGARRERRPWPYRPHPCRQAGADDDAQDDSTRSNREKRYRLRLREAEQKRDELTDTLTRARQAIVASVVAGSGHAPKVAELVSADMDALLTDDGLPDPEKIAGAPTSVVAEYGFARQPRPLKPNPQQGPTSGHPGTKSSWAGAIKGE